MTKQSDLPPRLWLRINEGKAWGQAYIEKAFAEKWLAHGDKLVAYVPEQELIDLRTRMQAEVEGARASAMKEFYEDAAVCVEQFYGPGACPSDPIEAAKQYGAMLRDRGRFLARAAEGSGG